jgi:hypothetical protein
VVRGISVMTNCYIYSEMLRTIGSLREGSSVLLVEASRRVDLKLLRSITTGESSCFHKPDTRTRFL